MPSIMLGVNHMNEEQILNSIKSSVDNGFYGFDTAPNYNSENYLGKAIRKIMKQYKLTREQFFICDKIDNFPLLEAKGHIKQLVENSLRKLDLEYIDLILIHWPTPDYFVQAWKELETIYEEKVVKAIGVSNFRIRHLRHLFNSDIHYVPMVNQIELHPLRTVEDQTAFHREHGIITNSYAPLCRLLPALSEAPIIYDACQKYHKTNAQIILRWHIQNGYIPTFKSSNPTRIRQNQNVFDFELTQSEMIQISNLNMDFKYHVESVCCPGF